VSDLVSSTLKYFFKILALTPHIKALGLISEFQPMRSTDFDNLKQQNGLDSSCKAALRCYQRLAYIFKTRDKKTVLRAEFL
jgi:hypothetical protein